MRFAPLLRLVLAAAFTLPSAAQVGSLAMPAPEASEGPAQGCFVRDEDGTAQIEVILDGPRGLRIQAAPDGDGQVRLAYRAWGPEGDPAAGGLTLDSGADPLAALAAVAQHLASDQDLADGVEALRTFLAQRAEASAGAAEPSGLDAAVSYQSWANLLADLLPAQAGAATAEGEPPTVARPGREGRTGV